MWLETDVPVDLKHLNKERKKSCIYAWKTQKSNKIQKSIQDLKIIKKGKKSWPKKTNKKLLESNINTENLTRSMTSLQLLFECNILVYLKVVLSSEIKNL